MELWKTIRNFEDYQVSSNGYVRSANRLINQKSSKGNCYKRMVKGKALTPVDNGLGYLQITLRSCGETTRKYVHELVAEAFITKPEDIRVEVNHKDHNKRNNSVDNLEWVSRSENIKKMMVFYGKVKNQHYCECGSPICRKYSQCVKCSLIKRIKID